MNKIFVLAIVFSLFSTAWAANRFPIAQVVFSPSGERVLATTAGVADGSGFPKARLVIFNTYTGKQLRDTTAESQDTNQTPALVLNKLIQQEKDLLSQNGLWPGLTSVARLQLNLSNHAPDWKEGVTAGSTKVWPVKLWSVPIPIELKVYKAARNQCQYKNMLPKGDVPAYFTIQIGKQLIPTPLQPASPCASRYTLERIDVQSNRVFIILRAYEPGYEGPDATAVFIAAKLN